MTSIYLIGSLRNPEVPLFAEKLRTLGFDVFDDWHAAGPEADDWWQRYEQARGHTYPQALEGHAAKHVYDYDRHHLNRCEIAILLMPAGKSGHLEFGFMVGQGKPGYILFDKEPERWDVMTQFADKVFFNQKELIKHVQRWHGRPRTPTRGYWPL